MVESAVGFDLTRLLGSGKPHARLRLHIGDQLLQIAEAGTAFGVRRKGKHYERPLAIGHVEFILENMENQIGRRQSALRAKVNLVIRYPDVSSYGTPIAIWLLS